MKLGRALGYGTRHAAKTLAAVAEAAAAPDPRHPNGAAETPARPEPTRAAAPPPPAAQPAPVRQARVASRSMWAPLATFSSALWLRVTGCFFALVAMTMASGAWRTRSALRPGADPASLRHLWLFLGFAVLFGYFAVSSFVRARLRERRAAARGGR